MSVNFEDFQALIMQLSEGGVSFLLRAPFFRLVLSWVWGVAP